MARRTVVEVQCSRCDRKEFREGVPDTGVHPAITPSMALIVRTGDGLSIDFEDLCEPCVGAVKSHLEAIGKKIVGLSPERKKKDEEPSEEKKEKRVAKKKSPATPPDSSSLSSTPSSPSAPLGGANVSRSGPSSP